LISRFSSSTGIDLPARARRVGYVFQDYALFPHLTVAHNVGFTMLGSLIDGLDRFSEPKRNVVTGTISFDETRLRSLAYTRVT
jgi:ABC-type sulfate/molybdate transport systems ATPase subunit